MVTKKGPLPKAGPPREIVKEPDATVMFYPDDGGMHFRVITGMRITGFDVQRAAMRVRDVKSAYAMGGVFHYSFPAVTDGATMGDVRRVAKEVIMALRSVQNR